jgi:uncharacterized protein DUF4142
MAELKGDAFDKSFARDMVADHKKDIAAYKKEAKQNTPPATTPKTRCRSCKSTWIPRSPWSRNIEPGDNRVSFQ